MWLSPAACLVHCMAGCLLSAAGAPMGKPNTALTKGKGSYRQTLVVKEAPTGKPQSIGFARRSHAVTYKRQRKYLYNKLISAWKGENP